MNIQDRRGSLTAEELRQKYNLDALVKDRKAIENTTETLTQLNNEQNNMIEAVILSLSGIELQDNISLWFNNGIPTLENIPSINWEDNETKNDHIGDLYYNRETGFVYQFNYINEEYIWNQVNEPRLIQAMALTNAAVDVADNERKVFLATPKPPYSNGDWYIKENGDLYICQLSKDIEELYNEYDFIVASKYALGTLAAESNNKIVIMAGQVTTIIETVSSIEEQIEDNKYYIDEDGVKQLIASQVFNLERTVGGMQQTIKYSGGYNLLENCVKQFSGAGWAGNFINVTNTEIQQNSLTKSALQFMNGTEEREIQVPNGIYNFSARYKKLIELALCKITINGQEIIFDGTGWLEKELTFEVKSNTISIVFFSDTDNSLWMADILFIPGDTKRTWTPNPNEINTGTIKLGGDILTISSANAKTKFEATTDGVRIKSTSSGLTTTEYTKDGTKTNKLEAKTAVISELSFSKIGNQVVLKVVDR